MRFKVKKTLFSTYCTVLLLLYALPFWNASIFTKLIILKSKVYADWPSIQCNVIGRIDNKREMEMLRPLPYCDAETIKPIINEAFVASSGDIISTP